MDCRPRVDRVLILFVFRLLHCLCFVNPIPAGRLKPLFFMSSFSCPFVCTFPIVVLPFFESEKVFCWPRCLKQLDGAEFCIERPTGLPRIALHMPRTAFLSITRPLQTLALYVIYPCCFLPLFYTYPYV